MSQLRKSLAIFFCFVFLFSSIAYVEAAVSVKGYFRKDGTYVQPHYRSNPDGNPYNNWSYPGNVNPYTGEVAGGNPGTYLKNYPSVPVYSPLPSASPQPSNSFVAGYDRSYPCKVYPGDPSCQKQQEEELKRSLQAQIQALFSIIVQLNAQITALQKQALPTN